MDKPTAAPNYYARRGFYETPHSVRRRKLGNYILQGGETVCTCRTMIGARFGAWWRNRLGR